MVIKWILTVTDDYNEDEVMYEDSVVEFYDFDKRSP